MAMTEPLPTSGDTSWYAWATEIHNDVDALKVVEVATYSAGWPARPTADLVFWVATDVAATAPGAATGDDIIILAQDADLTTIAAANNGSVLAAISSAPLLKVAAGAAVENIGAVESNVQTVATTGSTETLDTSVYGVFDMTMDQNCTFTFSNPAPSGKATIFTLILRGAFTPTWPASVDWPDATQPTYTTPSVYTFMTVDAGTTWLGAQAGKAFS